MMLVVARDKMIIVHHIISVRMQARNLWRFYKYVSNLCIEIFIKDDNMHRIRLKKVESQWRIRSFINVSLLH